MRLVKTRIFYGESGNKYEFEIVSPRHDWGEEEAGVYIFAENDNGQYTPLYIGETSDMARRWQEHQRAEGKWECASAEGANCICFYEVDEEDERIFNEIDLIRKFDTPCNEQ